MILEGVSTDLYGISAKAAGRPAAGRCGRCYSLLAERFDLRVYRTRREANVYRLVSRMNGPKTDSGWLGKTQLNGHGATMGIRPACFRIVSTGP